MTVKETKKRLSDVRRMKFNVRMLEEHRDSLETKITRTTPVSEITGIHGSAATDRMSEYVADLEETDKEIGKLQHEIRAMANMINSMEYAPYKAILFCYYIDGMTWERTAEVVHYSVRQAQNLHGHALTVLAQILSDDGCEK